MDEQFSRTEMLIGKEALNKLRNSNIAIFGIGGVGSYVLEALVRVGVNKFILVDKDVIDITNLNRQIIATTKSIGMPKVEVAKQRILDINPNAEVEVYQEFFLPNSDKYILNKDISYIVDSVDTVTAKIELAIRAKELNIPIISCMGTGNKLDATKFEVADIYETSMCPLAKVMRKELKKRGIDRLKVVYSKEEPIKQCAKINVPASISFVPSTAGLIMAGEVIKDIIYT